MSYDIRFGVKVAGAPEECYAVIGRPEHDSPTYNIGEMLRKAMDWDFEQGEWYPVMEALPKVLHGVNELTLNRAAYKQYNAPNGWGTVNTAVTALESIQQWFTSEWGGLHGSWNADVPLECIYMRW